MVIISSLLPGPLRVKSALMNLYSNLGNVMPTIENTFLDDRFTQEI